MDQEKAAESLKTILRNCPPEVRASAVRSIGHGTPDARRNACYVFRHSALDGPPLELMLSLLSDSERKVRIEAAITLRINLQHKRSGREWEDVDLIIPVLVEALQHGDERERAEAAIQIGYTYERSAIPPLQRAQGDPCPEVRAAAIDALRSILDAAAAHAKLAYDHVSGFWERVRGRADSHARLSVVALSDDPAARIIEWAAEEGFELTAEEYRDAIIEGVERLPTSAHEVKETYRQMIADGRLYEILNGVIIGE